MTPTLTVGVTAFNSGTSPKTVASSWVAGDLFVVFGVMVNNQTSPSDILTTPTVSGLSGTGLTFASIDLDINEASGTHCWGSSWQASATGTGSGNIQTTNGTTDHWGIMVVKADAGTHNGIGAHGNPNNTALTQSVSVVGPDSALGMLIGDWGAGAPAGFSFTPAGATTRQTGTQDAGQYTYYGGTWAGQGAGSTSYGLTGITASGQPYTKIFVEIKGVALPPTGPFAMLRPAVVAP